MKSYKIELAGSAGMIACTGLFLCSLVLGLFNFSSTTDTVAKIMLATSICGFIMTCALWGIGCMMGEYEKERGE